MMKPLALSSLLLVTVAASPASWMSHRKCVRKHSKRREPHAIGSLCRFQRPTADRVARWFHANEPTADFNHDAVGMTNPCLHISLVDENVDVRHVSSSSSNSNEWWPPAQQEKGWKMLRYRRRVGQGAACYDAVRDAALEWEFEQESKGIVQVHSTPRGRLRQSRGKGFDVIHNVHDDDVYGPTGENALKLWSGPGGKRLATFTRAGKWGLYVVNPVTVVYDLLDQRGPSTTYTSTAYATCKGHWLRGEERVTVAHRDEGNAVDVEIVSYSKPANTLWGRMIWPFVAPLQDAFFKSQMDALEGVGLRNTEGTSIIRPTVIDAASLSDSRRTHSHVGGRYVPPHGGRGGSYSFPSVM